MIDFSLAPQKKEMVEALRTLMKIESVKGEPQNLMPYGKGVFDVLMKMISMADSMYFDSVNLFSHLGYVDYGEGDEMLAILTHLDVVPAGEGWTVPPFDCTEKDGKLYGRGALDNKGAAVASLFALNAIKENCVTLNKRVRLIFGCDEESGWSDIEFYKNSGGEIPTMAFSPDAEFPIINAEKGLMHYALKMKQYEPEDAKGLKLASINGGNRVNVVPDFCECTLQAQAAPVRELLDIFNQDIPVEIEMEEQGGNLHLMCKGAPAHGSKPQDGKNAVAYILAFLNTLPLVKNHLSDAVYELSRYVGLETNGRSMGMAFEDNTGALTLNMGYFKTTDDGLEVGLDIRYPVHMKGNQVMRHVLDKLSAFEMEVKFALPAHYVEEDSELVRGLKQAYEEIMDEPATCMAMGGATYARAFPNAVAFGPLFPGQEGTEHQADEYIEADSLVKLADIIANAIMALCT